MTWNAWYVATNTQRTTTASRGSQLGNRLRAIRRLGNGFKDLHVWQKSRDLAVYVYQITNQGQFKRDYGLRDQVRRSAVSVPSNIAEGDERDTDKDSVRFFYIAKGSLAELRTQMEIAYQVNYIDEKWFHDFEAKAVEIGKMLGSLIRARSSKP